MTRGTLFLHYRALLLDHPSMISRTKTCKSVLDKYIHGCPKRTVMRIPSPCCRTARLLSSLLSSDHYEEAHRTEHCNFEPLVVVQPDRDHPDVRQHSVGAAHNLLPRDEQLPVQVEPAVVHLVVVPLREERELATRLRALEFWLKNSLSALELALAFARGDGAVRCDQV